MEIIDSMEKDIIFAPGQEPVNKAVVRPVPGPRPNPVQMPECDDLGNPQGDAFDLVKDGSMKGYRVIILDLMGLFLDDVFIALERKGFSVKVYSYTEGSPCGDRELEELLSDAKTQLWVISSEYRVLNRRERKVICRFFLQGRGLYLLSDNYPVFADTNILLAKLFRSKMNGDYEGKRFISVNEDGHSPGIVRDHPIATGIRSFYEGVTISHVEMADGLTPLAYSSDGQVLIAYYDRDGKRALVDGGYTRLQYRYNMPSTGTARLIANCAC